MRGTTGGTEHDELCARRAHTRRAGPQVPRMNMLIAADDHLAAAAELELKEVQWGRDHHSVRRADDGGDRRRDSQSGLRGEGLGAHKLGRERDRKRAHCMHVKEYNRRG